ncbi:MAG: tetratricopeptide repeat protein [Coriobacteriales bacterium]|nr:tetratricopeptide repeat protein [Coriobacteriales bacterium]
MSIKLDPASVAGSIVKAGATAAAAAALGPVAGIAVAAGVDAAVTDAVTKAFSDAAGSALKVSSGDPNLDQRVTQAVSSSLWSAFDKVEHDKSDPCVIIRPVRRAIIASATSEGGLAKASDGDGKLVMRRIVASACSGDPNADISTDVQERIVNAFFDELVRKMQNDALMSNLLIYRTLGQGFGVLYQQLYGVTVRLDSIESMLKDVSAATAGQSELMRLLQALRFRSDEGLSLGGTDSGADTFREELRSALQEILEKRAADSASHLPLMLTQRPMVRKFVGRTKELEEVEGLLEHNQLVAIRADGGVGKTAIAARLVSELVGRVTGGTVCSYRHFAWVRFTGKLLEDLSAIEVPGAESATGDERAEAVRRWLRTTNESTLLVIDNMDDHPGDVAVGILTGLSPSVRVLITTRVALDFAEEYPLNPMDSDQVFQMFYAYYLDERSPRPIEDIESRPDCQAAKEIVNRADSNALLVELIARAARSEGGDLSAYWRAHEERIFADKAAGLSTGHARSHGSGGDLTLQGQVLRLYGLSSITDEQRRAMALLAQFPVSVPIYYKVREWAGFAQDDMNRLVELGWVEWDTQRYLVHAVVRESVLAQLDADNVVVDPSEYGELVNRVTDIDGYLDVTEGYETVRERMVVPETIAALMDCAGSDELSLATLLNNLGAVCWAEGDYAAARAHLERALQIVEHKLGPNHPYTRTSRNNLIRVLDKLAETPAEPPKESPVTDP